MSLYYEAADVLANTNNTGGSLKSRIYKKKDRKSSPAQLFALVTETAKWSAVLKQVIEKSSLLDDEKKLTPILALLLTHDLLISKNGVAAPANHVLRLAVTRHKARLTAEFTKARLQAGHSTLVSFKEAVNDGQLENGQEDSKPTIRHPRWVRVNTLKDTVAHQLATTFAGYEQRASLGDILSAPGSAKICYADPNIPNLLAFPAKIDLTKSPAYLSGRIIFQDKASCFPAYLLDIKHDDGDIIDGCAAPGNKTTHLAAILAEQSAEGDHDAASKVIAFEKDKLRAETLIKMVKLASADATVTIKAGRDFLAAQPDAAEFAKVGAILLDPSCSGSGIVGRDDVVKMHLPEPQSRARAGINDSRGKKRKRDNGKTVANNTEATLQVELDERSAEENPVEDHLTARLTALSAFQLQILKHAMRFPQARKITYSTCSIHFEENEGVVFKALASSIAKERGWTILKRASQVQGLRKWDKRGMWEDAKVDESSINVQYKEEVLEACIRCEQGTQEGTMGFFVAALIREENTGNGFDMDITSAHEISTSLEEEDAWEGFSDEENAATKETGEMEPLSVAPGRQKKRHRKK